MADSARYHIRLIGHFGVFDANGGEIRLRSRSARAILALLALERRGCARSTLTTLLWPEVDGHNGGTSLRQALKSLRDNLVEGLDDGDSVKPILSANDMLELDHSLFSVDVDRLSARLQAGLAGESSWTDSVGVLFDGWSGPSAEFETRVETARSARHNEWRNRLVTIAEDHLREGRFDLAADAAGAVLKLDVADEAAVAIAMDSYIALGAKGIAVDIYRRHEDEMRRVLETTPAPHLAERLTSPPRDSRPYALPRSRIDQRLAVSVSAFRCQGVPPELSFAGEALAEEVVGRLSNNPRVRVHDQRGGPGQGAPQLLVEGAIRLGQGHVRVRVSLVAADTREVVATEVLEASGADIAAVIDSMAAGISARLQTAIQVHADRLAADQLPVQGADRIGKARHLLWQTGRDNNAKARALLSEALLEEPGNLVGLTTMVFVRLLDAWSLWCDDLDEAVNDALAAARAAVQLSPHDPWCLFSLGTALGAAGQLSEAIAIQRRAVERNPDFAPAIGELGRLLIFAGRLDEGIAEAHAAREKSPGDPHLGLWLNALGLGAFLKGDPQEALAWVDKATGANAQWYQNHLLRAAVLQVLGRAPEAASSIQKTQALVPRLSLARLAPGHPFGDLACRERFHTAVLAAGCPA